MPARGRSCPSSSCWRISRVSAAWSSRSGPFTVSTVAGSPPASASVTLGGTGRDLQIRVARVAGRPLRDPRRSPAPAARSPPSPRPGRSAAAGPRARPRTLSGWPRRSSHHIGRLATRRPADARLAALTRAAARARAFGRASAGLVGRGCQDQGRARDPDRDAAGGPGRRRRVAAAPRPTVRLPGRPRRGRGRGARRPGQGPVRRPAAGRLRAGTPRHQRQRPRAQPALEGDLLRARPDPGDRHPDPLGRRPLRGLLCRRAAARRAAPARRHRERRTGCEAAAARAAGQRLVSPRGLPERDRAADGAARRRHPPGVLAGHPRDAPERGLGRRLRRRRPGHRRQRTECGAGRAGPA